MLRELFQHLSNEYAGSARFHLDSQYLPPLNRNSGAQVTRMMEENPMGREQDFLTVLQTARNRGVKTPFFLTVIDNFAKSKWQLHTETGDPPLIPLNDVVMRQLDHPVDVFVAPCLYPNELAAGDVVLLASIGLEDLTSDCNAMGPRFRDFLILADAHARLEALGLFATLGWTEQEEEEAA